MKPIVWASIGCGDVCERKSLPAMYKAAGSRVKGIYARHQANAQDFAARHQVPQVYPTVEALMHDAEVDIVYISTPPHMHLPYTLQALQAGKHVYVEKPMAMNYAECVRMCEEAEQRGLHLFVAHYRRALPYFNKVKQWLQEGAIGNLLGVNYTMWRPAQPHEMDASTQPWRLKPELSGAGHFFDLAPHVTDIIAYITQSHYAQAQGFATNHTHWYNAEDAVHGSFLLSNGVAGSIQWIFATAPTQQQDTLCFTGTQGQILCNMFSFEPIVCYTQGQKNIYDIPPPTHIQQPLVETILQHLRGQGQCPATGSSALTTAWAMDKFLNR